MYIYIYIYIIIIHVVIMAHTQLIESFKYSNAVSIK